MTSHQHSWQTDSLHPTSDGLVVYQVCRCGQRRIVVTQ